MTARYEVTHESLHGKTHSDCALQRLEAMGIIEIIHGKGSYVKGTDTSGEHQPIDIAEISRDHLLSPPDYEEFWRFRYTIESEAFNLFASRATDADFQALDDLVRKIIDSSTQEELEEATYEYQTYIYTHCGNRYIANSMMIHESVLRASIHTIQVQRNQSRGMVAQWRISVTNFLRNKDAVSAINILAKENILHLQNPKQP